MFTRIYRPVVIAVVVSLILLIAAVTPVRAEAQQPATDRDNAGAPLPGWVTLAPGTSHWYKFHYDYDGSKNPPEASVVVQMDMPGALSFAIETPGNLARPQYDSDGHFRNPVGVGSLTLLRVHNHDGTPEQIKHQMEIQNEHGFYVADEMVLSWTGSARASDTYYVIVTNNHDHPCAYTLSISGATVSY